MKLKEIQRGLLPFLVLGTTFVGLMLFLALAPVVHDATHYIAKTKTPHHVSYKTHSDFVLQLRDGLAQLTDISDFTTARISAFTDSVAPQVTDASSDFYTHQLKPFVTAVTNMANVSDQVRIQYLGLVELLINIKDR